MMVVDTSVIFAILQGEPEAYAFTKILGEEEFVFLPSSVLVEASILAIKRSLGKDLDALIGALNPEIVPLDETLAYLAADAHRAYGKGRHKANLNFVDCIVYATAKYLKVPLLHKGNDFSYTDITTPDQSS
jgi:ribonuclease VapC